MLYSVVAYGAGYHVSLAYNLVKDLQNIRLITCRGMTAAKNSG